MKKISISNDLYREIMGKKRTNDETFEDILKRIFHIYDFQPSKISKIVFIGHAGVGKTSVVKSFFEFDDPEDILNKSLEPTRGLEYHNYSFFDVKVGVVDTSGQELAQWLDIDGERVFSGADYILFVCDASKFEENSAEIYDNLYNLINIVKIQSTNATIALFLHKIDLIEPDDFHDFKRMILGRHHTFMLSEDVDADIPIFFTSIKKKYLRLLNLAFMNIFYVESDVIPRYYDFIDLV